MTNTVTIIMTKNVPIIIATSTVTTIIPIVTATFDSFGDSLISVIIIKKSVGGITLLPGLKLLSYL